MNAYIARVLIGCAIVLHPALVSGQTVQSVLRALQERRFILEWKESYNDPEKTEIKPIIWGEGGTPVATAFPPDAELITLENTIAVLNQASRIFDDIKEKFIAYDVTKDRFINLQRQTVNGAVYYGSTCFKIAPIDLPSVGSFDADNWRRKLKLLASNINQLRCLEWPAMVQYGTIDYGSGENDSLDWGIDFPGLRAPYIYPPEKAYISAPMQIYTRDNAYSVFNWALFGQAYKYLPPPSGAGEPSEPIIESNLNCGATGVVGVKAAVGPARTLTAPAEPPPLAGRIEFFKSGVVADGGDLTERFVLDNLADAEPGVGLQLASLTKFPSSGASERTLGSYNQWPEFAEISSDMFLNCMFSWLKLDRPALDGLLVEEDKFPSAANVHNYVFHIDQASEKQSYTFDVEGGALQSRHAMDVALTTVAVPSFTPIPLTYHEPVAEFVPGSVEPSVRDFEMVRIYLGRGSDGCQTGWLSPRVDGFGSLRFRGSPNAFEVLYEEDFLKFADAPIGGSTFDSPQDFSAEQKAGSGWKSRFAYIAEWFSPRLKQVKGRDVLVTVEYPSCYRKVLKFYWVSANTGLVDGFYVPEGLPFKTIVISNPTAGSGMSLPTNPARLLVNDSDMRYYNCSLAGMSIVNGVPELDGNPTAVFTFTCDRASSGAYWKQEITVEEVDSAGGGEWQVKTTVGDSTTDSMVWWEPYRTPLNTYEPHLWYSNVGYGDQTVTCTWVTAPDNRNEILTKVVFSGSAGWPANGREITWSPKGWRTESKELLNGAKHKVVESVVGNARNRAMSLAESVYSSEKVTYTADLQTETLAINGEACGDFSYSNYGELALAVYPGGYREAFNWQAGINGLEFVRRSGWGNSFASGITSVSQWSMLGDLRKHVVKTTEGVTLGSDEGEDFTGWGAPRKMKHLRGAPSTLSYEEQGLNWGLPLTEVDGEGVSTGVTGYDWLSRATGIKSATENITPDYSNVLNPKFSGSGGSSFQSTFSPTGLLKAVEGGDGVNGTFRVGTAGDSFIKDFENHSVPLTVNENGFLRSIGTGAGSRGGIFDIGVAAVNGLGNMRYTETVPLTKTGTAGTAVRTYYDARGRVRLRTGPDANGNPRSEEWTYDDTTRSVTYKPGAGPVAQSTKRTLSDNGQTLTISRNNVDLLQYERQATGTTLIQITRRFGPSFGSGAGWEEVSREVVDPTNGITKYTPWSLATQTVTVNSEPPAQLSKVTIKGPSGLNLDIPLSQGQSTTVQGTLQGVSVNLVPGYTSKLLTSLKGRIDGKDAGVTMQRDGRLLSLSTPLSTKGFEYGQGPNYSVTVTDSMQLTTASFTADAAGDVTTVSGPGMPTLNLETTDTATKRETTLRVTGSDSSVTLTSNQFGLLTGKSYNGGSTSGGITETYVRTSDGSLDSTVTKGPDGNSISVDVTPAASGSTTGVAGGYIVQENYPSGSRKTVTGPNDGRSFTYQRDSLGKETHTAGPWSGWSVERVQDTNGRFGTLLIKQGGVLQKQFSFGYDANSRLSNTDSGSLIAVYSSRNSAGQVQSLSRGEVVTAWGYDTKNRATGISHMRLGANVLSYDISDRDARHRIKSRTASLGRSWTGLDYDGADQLKTANAGGRALSYNHDARGNRYSQGAANQTVASHSVNKLDQIYARVLNERGFGIQGRATPGSLVQVFQGGQQLSNLAVNSTTGDFSGYWSAGSSAGGLISPMVRGTLAGAGANGRDAVAEQELHFVIPPANESIPTDAAGRPKQDAFWNYTWDELDRLLKLTRRAGTFRRPDITGEVIEFHYDSDGRRTEKIRTLTYSDNRTEVEASKVLWTGWLPILEERSRNSQVIGRRWFQWGEDVSGSLEGAAGIGGLVAIIDERASLPTRLLYPLHDGLGNITAVLDGAGTMIARYDYGPFGEPLGEYGETDACPFRFQTKWYDPESEYYYFGYRYYSPRLGRWLTRDPLGEEGGINLYAYCGNDPVNKHDPTGLQAWTSMEVAQAHNEGMRLLLNGGASEMMGLLAAETQQINQQVASGQMGVVEGFFNRQLGKAAQVLAGVGFAPFLYKDAAEYHGTYNPGEIILHQGLVNGVIVNGWNNFGNAFSKGDFASVNNAVESSEDALLAIFGGRAAMTRSPAVTSFAPKVVPDVAPVVVNLELANRLAAFKAWKTSRGYNVVTFAQFKRFAGAHRPNSAGATLYGNRSGFADWSRQVESIHGNTAGNQNAWLYRLETSSGDFLKWGVSENPATRYPASFLEGKRLIPIRQGPRSIILQLERQLTERYPGPLNFESWAGNNNLFWQTIGR